MNRQAVLALGVFFSMMVATVAVTGAGDSSEWPTRWTVNGNGVTGVLELSIGEDESVSGRLLEATVQGYVSGRHLFLRRTVDDRTEIWEGWLGGPRPGEGQVAAGDTGLMVAGTISVSGAGGTQVYPWFGTPETGSDTLSEVAGEAAAVATQAAPPGAEDAATTTATAGTHAAASESAAPAAGVTATVAGATTAEDTQTAPAARAVTTETPAATVPQAAPDPAAAPRTAEPAGGPLSGFWSSMQGRAEIVQDGNRLTAILPDGSSHSGRMTGVDTLVVGLRQGCCNGKLEGPDVIAWSDGVRWTRTD